MKTRHILGVLAVFLCLSLSTAFARESQWVASEGAKLKKDHAASSETIATLPIGTEVTVLNSEKSWRHIRTPSEQEGWIYRGRLSDSPPERKRRGRKIFSVPSREAKSVRTRQTRGGVYGVSQRKLKNTPRKRGHLFHTKKPWIAFLP